jgi:ubiquinone/menaquinone biosynthesis C-methylase UbiE
MTGPSAAELTDRMRDVWSLADFNPVAARVVLVGELLARAVDVHHGDRVLDVAAGTGNAALAAARRGGRVTASDFVPAMLATASRRAAVEGLELRTEVADAQHLPFPDDRFDIVLSTFGAMFAPDQQRTADELVRVCRPGGRIGLANWTPDGLLGRMQPAGGPGPDGPSPLDWGTEEHCRALFGDRISALHSTVRTHEFCAASAAEHMEFLARHLGPAKAAFAELDPAARQQAMAAGAAEFERANRATDGTLVAEAEYREIIATVA